MIWNQCQQLSDPRRWWWFGHEFCCSCPGNETWATLPLWHKHWLHPSPLPNRDLGLFLAVHLALAYVGWPSQAIHVSGSTDSGFQVSEFRPFGCTNPQTLKSGWSLFYLWTQRSIGRRRGVRWGSDALYPAVVPRKTVLTVLKYAHIGNCSPLCQTSYPDRIPNDEATQKPKTMLSCIFRQSATVSQIGLTESCTCRRFHGGPPPPGWLIPPWLTDPPWLADPPLAGWTPPCDGWLGRSAFALTKRTCLARTQIVCSATTTNQTAVPPEAKDPGNWGLICAASSSIRPIEWWCSLSLLNPNARQRWFNSVQWNIAGFVEPEVRSEGANLKTGSLTLGREGRSLNITQVTDAPHPRMSPRIYSTQVPPTNSKKWYQVKILQFRLILNFSRQIST